MNHRFHGLSERSRSVRRLAASTAWVVGSRVVNRHHIRLLALLFTVGIAGVFVAAVGVPGARSAVSDASVPGIVQVDATFEHLGFVWWMEGDLDLDGSVILEFREQGTSSWRAGAMAVRAYPSIYVSDRDPGPLGLNYWGASALFLTPGTTYEARLTLTDPDGGSATRTVVGTTRTMPVPATGGRNLLVVPGAGGGQGTTPDPFRGLQAAADAAVPGDTFTLAAGSYAPFELTTSGDPGNPITFRGPESGVAVVDGGGTDRGVVTLGRWNAKLAHVIVEGITIQDGRWGIDAQNTHDITIKDNTITNVDHGILNRRDNAWEANQTVCDNTIAGRTTWPASGIPSERGIDLRGSGNVVCYNQVQYFGDCISVQPFTGASFGNDIFGNDVAYCVDDGIEIDYNQANVRVWRNRVTNARMGVSVQPIRGGPAYIFRNEFINLESVPIKMHNSTTGFVVVHNTGVKTGNGHGDNGAMWRNATFRNNLFLGTRYAFEFTTVADEGFRDLDYNGWGTSSEIGGANAPYFKWDNVRYDRITDLPATVEDNGVAVTFADVVRPGLPADWDVAVAPGFADLRLVSGSAAIDRGDSVANLNDAFSISGRPDLGAFEAGGLVPSYGPRGGGGSGVSSPHRVGLVDPVRGLWFLTDGVGGDLAPFYYGNPGDVPFVGDWDCDGSTTPGLYRQSDGFVYLRNANTQGNANIRFFFGNPGDMPLVGDFNGDGCDTVSIYRPSNQTFHIINRLGLNDGGLGTADLSYVFGNPGDKPYIGDFDGDGIDTAGLHRESTGLVYFRNSHTQGNADNDFVFGNPGDRLVAGDWNDDGIDTPALFRPSNRTFYFRYSNSQGIADAQFWFGESSWLPIAEW